jgi:hypothetical protein
MWIEAQKFKKIELKIKTNLNTKTLSQFAIILQCNLD